MEMNFLAIVVAAIVPMIIGFIWYNPKVFGVAWMRAAEMTEDKMKGGNMAVIFGVSIVLSILLAFSVNGMVIHQVAVAQLTYPDMSAAQAFLSNYENAYRTLTHGLLHGAIGGVFFVLPILGINALFERKNWKYIMVNSGYWILTLAIMGGIICAWK